MSVNMQGSWTVSVKAKNASFPQRFVIAGAASGNGTYEGKTTTPPVFVTGDAWSVTIQANPGTGWVDSADQIKFPTVSGGLYRFDIESNDPGPDQDFNDLVLTCSTPQTATDFVVYGNVSTYSGGCVLNPCFRRWVVIDTELGLVEALRNPVLRDPIRKLYPERLIPRPPQPNPPPFRPLMIPLQDSAVTPARQAQVLRVSETQAAPGRGKAADTAQATQRVTPLRVVERDARAVRAQVDFDRVGLASLVDRLRLRCEVAPLPGVALRFQEYDRTAAELAGGAYSGDGDRENLGVVATDRNGNYIFRFSRSLADFIAEADIDVAPGEDVLVQIMPDLVAQLLDAMAPGGVAYESAPRFNVPLLKRIDLCIPQGTIGGGLNPCSEGLIIQAIGNVFIGPHQVGGSRVGFNNTLGATGRITARNSMGPQTRCAAWQGTLDLYACLNNHDIRYYTIRYKRPSESTWKFFQEPYKHQKQANIGLPNYDGDPVGPFDVSLQVDGGAAVVVKAYDNIEVQSGWISTHLLRKAQITSAIYEAGQPGPMQFRIEGYRAGGARFAGADDIITLYLDNTAPQLYIDENITMGLQTLGNCALFTVPDGSPAEPLTVRFKADEAQGFLGSYELYMEKGATGVFAVLPPAYPQSPGVPPPPYRARSYEHGDDLVCNELRGTFDDPTADPVTGIVSVDLTPSSGAWLEPSQTFCAFSVRVSATKRSTDGYGGFGPWYSVPVLIGLQKA